jgi:hypothetical protein
MLYCWRATAAAQAWCRGRLQRDRCLAMTCGLLICRCLCCSANQEFYPASRQSCKRRDADFKVLHRLLQLERRLVHGWECLKC